MIEPEYIEKSAVFDDEKIYRYNLVRRWAPGPIVLWIMLNPSTADDVKLDPTLLRCLDFTRCWLQLGSGGVMTHDREAAKPEAMPWQFGGFEVCNLYAFRSSDPNDLWFERTVLDENDVELTVAPPADPIGPNNDAAIVSATKRAALVICGWGDGAKPHRERAVAQMLADNGIQPYALMTTSSGAPRHPLARGKSRVPPMTVPKPWHAKGLR